MRRLLSAVAVLLLLLSPCHVRAQEASALLALLPDVRLLPAPSTSFSLTVGDEGPATPPCDQLRILADDRGDPCHGSALTLAAAQESDGEETPTFEPAPEKSRPSKFWTFAIPVGVVAGASANAWLETPHQSFHFGNEGWFGENTYAGGTDKAAHFVDYYIISKELSFLYAKLGYSQTQSILAGVGISVLGGLTNEFGDGFNRYGFSYEDLVMNTAGAISAALVSWFGAHDLVGFRRGFLLPPYSSSACCPPGSVGQAYQSQIFTADLKLAGVARRLNLNVGPLRYLLVSATYATKGYATEVPSLFERQVGVEIGLNLEEILNSVGVRRNTWWGYALHVVLDNVRLPFTSVGFQYDLNSGQWFGPGNGNSYATR
jgi:hypothetical protein